VTPQSCAHIVLDTADIVRDGDFSPVIPSEIPPTDRLSLTCLCAAPNIAPIP
jgi:hypothetical protein